MKKRVVSLFLSILMVFGMVGVLSGCANNVIENDYISALDKDARTIVLYGIKGDTTTQDAIEAVQEQMNVYTKGKFNTKIILRLYNEDEYESKLEEAMAQDKKIYDDELARIEADKLAQKETLKDVETLPETQVETTAETMSSEELSVREVKYPEEDGTQVDIFLVKGYDMLKKYSDEKDVAPLGEYINSGTNKRLKEYIYPTFMDSMSINGSIVGVATNHALGEYEYLILDKALVDELYYDIDDISSYEGLKEYLKDVKESVEGTSPMIGKPSLNAFLINKNNPLIGAEIGNSGNPQCLLASTDVVSALNIMRYYGTDDKVTIDMLEEKAGTFASAIITGNYTLRDKIDEEKYYIVPLKMPVADNDNVFESVFCVGAYTKEADRALEILTYMTIDSNFANLFHYGIEGENYRIDEETGLVDRLNDEYMMGLYDTGNVFMLKASTDMDEETLELAADNWAAAKLQNLDSIENPYIGMLYDETKYVGTIDAKVLTKTYITEKGPDGVWHTTEKVEYLPVTYRAFGDILAEANEYMNKEYKTLMEAETLKNVLGATVNFDTYASNVANSVENSDMFKELFEPDNDNSLTALYNRFINGESLEPTDEQAGIETKIGE